MTTSEPDYRRRRCGVAGPARRGRRFALLAGLLLLAGAPLCAAAVLKVATLATEGSVEMKRLREAAGAIDERTQGRVQFKFYPGGVMGDDQAVLRKIRLGQLQGAVLTAGGLTQVYSDIQLYNLPLEFSDLAAVDRARAALDPLLLAGLEEHGFVAFGIAEVGFAYAMSKAPVFSVAEAQTQKVWVPEGDLGAARALQSFGISPIPLSIADVLSGLQTGLINGVAVPPVGAIALQWHTQLQNVLDLPLLYVYGLMVISTRPFERLSDPDQVVVREELAASVRDVNARNRADHESAVAALKSLGLTWNEPSPEQVAEWRGYARRASAQLIEDGFVSADLYQALRAAVGGD